MKVELPNDFIPRAYQTPYMRYFDMGGKRACWVMHRRGGKDLTSLHQTSKMAHERTGAYWHVYPTAEQGKKAVWEGFTKDGKRIMEQVFPRAIRKRPKEFSPNGEMVVELKCGSMWRLVGSDKISLVGAGPVGVVFSEYSVAKPSAWNFIAPMLDENGGWASFIYTPRGNNHGKRLYEMAKKNPEWFCRLMTLEDTQAYDPVATIKAARERGMPEALVRQEYLCDFSAALVGAVWGDLLEALEKDGAMEEFGHERDGVFSSFDLGISDSTSIWLWRLNDGGVDFIDHYEAHGKPMSHYFDWLEQRSAESGYKYVKHWLPHDARARTLQTGQSILDQFIEWQRTHKGMGEVALGPSLSLLDGIQAGRWLLQHSVRFHPRCADGVEALKQYHYEYDEDRSTFGTKPEHDWSSHTADAFRYTACVTRVSEMLTRKPKVKVVGPIAVPINHGFTLNQVMWETARSTGNKRV
jgi:phage terminase large subunit